MEIDRVAVELRDTVARQPRLDLRRKIFRIAGRAGPRVIKWPTVAGVTIGRARINGVRVRTYEPTEVRSDVELLWIHGGGMIIGAPPMDDLLCTETAARLGIRITSVDYRLAPEHRFPAPLDDCYSVWLGMAHRLGSAARIVVGGQSAGGGLAASLVQRLHDGAEAHAEAHAGAHPIARPLAQWLFSPMLDDRTAADRSLDDLDHFMWNNASNYLGWKALLGRVPGSAEVPPYAVAARRDDLSGLPRTWLGVGDIDLFHNEDLDYARRLAAADVDVVVNVVAGAPHGFESVVPDAELARRFRSEAQDWLASVIA